MNTLIKICGLTNYEDASLAVELGAHAVGLNFYSGSPRCISLGDAQAIVRQLPASVWTVGVFVNQARSEVEHIARAVGLDSLQFHGDEGLDFCAGWDQWRVIKAVRMSRDTSFEEVAELKEVCDHLLFDRFDPSCYGGSGKEIDQTFIAEIQSRGLFEAAFLSGGLTPENVSDKIRQCCPFGVDVASGVEVAAGKKGAEKMKLFIERVKQCDSGAVS